MKEYKPHQPHSQLTKILTEMKKPNLKEVGSIFEKTERFEKWLEKKSKDQTEYIRYLKGVPGVSEDELTDELMLSGYLLMALQSIRKLNENLERVDYLARELNKT